MRFSALVRVSVGVLIFSDIHIITQHNTGQSLTTYIKGSPVSYNNNNTIVNIKLKTLDVRSTDYSMVSFVTLHRAF